MAYTPHTLVTFGGTLTEQGGQDEIWQCGVRGNTPVGFDGEVYLTEIGDNLAAWFTSDDAWHSAYSTLVWMKVADIDAAGHYPTPTYTPNEAEFATPPAGSRTGTGMPSFCTLAYSWLSSIFKRGPGTHGRIYPPNFAAVPVPGKSIVPDATTHDLADAAVALLTALRNDAGSQTFVPGIYSKIGGAFNDIDLVRVGNVIDTQHRRRERLPEVYAGATFT